MRSRAALVVLLGAAASMMFAWEMAQAPLYSDMAGLSWLEGTKRCLLATAGDLGILLAAALVPAALTRRLDWICLPRLWPPVALVCIAFAISTGFERHAVSAGRWVYGTNMPMVPLLGIGLAPAIQWLLIPVVCVFAARRFCPRRS